MANGFIDGIGYPMNGGLAAGLQMAKERQAQEKMRGLASGFANYVNAADDEQKKAALAQMAEADPETAFKVKQFELAREDKNTLTPYQQQTLDIQRKQLEQNAIPNTIKELQFVNEHPELKELYIQSKRGTNIYNNLSPFDKKRVENIASKIDENISAAEERKALYDRADQLLDKVDTGGIAGYGHSIQPEWTMSDDVAEFNSLANKLAPQQRPAGSGTTSDKDMEIYRKATIGWGKDKNANRSIIALGRKMAENDIAHEELRAAWISDGRSLTDFDKIWRKYVKEQRIYNDDGSINENRIDPYSWFASYSDEVQVPQSKEEKKQDKEPTLEEIQDELMKRGY